MATAAETKAADAQAKARLKQQQADAKALEYARTQATKNAQTAAAPPPPPSAGSGSLTVYLPSAKLMKAYGVSQATIDKLVNDPVNGGDPPKLALPAGASQWNATAFGDAIEGMQEYNLRQAILSTFGLTMPTSSVSDATGGNYAKQLKAVFNGVTAANGFMENVDMKRIGTPQSQANNVLVNNYQTLYNDWQQGITSSLRTATVNQEDNALNTISSNIQNWKFDNAQSKFINDTLVKLVKQPGAHLVDPNALMEVLRGNAPSGLGVAVDKQIVADYKSAFPGLGEYNAQPNAVKMTESNYSDYVRSIMNTATQYGAPMPTKEQMGQLLTGNVSPAEFSQRVTDIYAAVSNAPQSVKNMLASQFGVNQNHLMDYYANPKNAIQNMQRQVASAQVQDYSQRVGLPVGTEGSAQLADMARLNATAGNNPLGVGVGNIEQALLTASRDQGLTRANPGDNRQTINTNTLIGSQIAGFQGTTQAAAQTEVARAEQEKAAPFEKGGGYAENAKGVIGVGSAKQ